MASLTVTQPSCVAVAVIAVHAPAPAPARPGLLANAPPSRHFPAPRRRKAEMSSLDQYRVLPEHRHGYLMRDLVIFASSQPSHHSCLAGPFTFKHTTWATLKSLFAIGDSDLEAQFTAVYNKSIHDNIVSSIRATLPDANWGLNVLRLGFEPEPLDNPITVHLTVAADGGLSDENACKIVADIIGAIIAAAPPFSSQLIHVDVCRACKPSQASSPPSEFSLLDSNPEVYNSSARLPYSSIGPAQIECKGTLALYVQHQDIYGRNAVYALTCRHVVDPQDALGNPGRASPTHPSVTSPAAYDHNKTIETITIRLASLKLTPIDANPPQAEITALEQALQNAKQYNIAFGDVYATSGRGRSLPDFPGRSDWAIIPMTSPDIEAENKHVRSFGSFRSFHLPDGAPLDAHSRFAAAQYFAPGPHFKPVRDDLGFNELVFKPRSRTTAKWTAGKFNAIRSTQMVGGEQTKEWCLISLLPRDAMSAGGDSGSVIIDEEFRPVAMMWGGQESFILANGPTDLTYASPLYKIIRDIEICMHWAEGSVSMVLG